MATADDQQQEVTEIGFDELESEFLRKGNLIFIDVRNPDELLAQGAIPGAINIPLPEVPDAFKNLTNEEFVAKYGFAKNSTKPIVFSCRSGKRASAAIENLRGVIPFGNLRLYAGSFADWEARDGPVNK